MKKYSRLMDLKGHVGQVIGVSDWIEVDQQRIDLFAQATGDHQWIHVDVERARAGPFGTPIAHGFLTLSMLPEFLHRAFHVEDVRMGINYGLNKVRFISPVPVGSRLRASFKLLSATDLPTTGLELVTEMTVEIEGNTKPACVAESITRRYA